ncbi:bL21 family ribosomal protein [Patescibacteria group bacterium]|nr:bL21 family ribosomal protein [Patescibacteria group bacterium]
MFAVIELQGHQYIVREGDEIVVDLLELESSTYVCDNVLLVAEEE